MKRWWFSGGVLLAVLVVGLGLSRWPVKASHGPRLRVAVGPVRVRLQGRTDWSPVTGEQVLGDEWIQVGDGAKALIQADSHLKLEILANSELHWQANAEAPMDLRHGLFRFYLNGERHLLIDGQPALALADHGTGEVQVLPGVSQPVVWSTQGQFRLRFKDSEAPQAVAGAPMYIYHFHVEDIYSLAGQRLHRRNETPKEVNVHVPLRWQDKAEGPFTVQVAGSEDFLSGRRIFSNLKHALDLQKALLGRNFWRVGWEVSSWSELGQFEVSGQLLKAHFLFAGLTQRWLRWQANEDFHHFIGEESKDSQFPSAQTQVRWLNQPQWLITAGRGEIRYVRIRGVNDQQELSEYSQTEKVTGTAP